MRYTWNSIEWTAHLGQVVWKYATEVANGKMKCSNTVIQPHPASQSVSQVWDNCATTCDNTMFQQSCLSPEWTAQVNHATLTLMSWPDFDPNLSTVHPISVLGIQRLPVHPPSAILFDNFIPWQDADGVICMPQPHETALYIKILSPDIGPNNGVQNVTLNVVFKEALV